MPSHGSNRKRVLKVDCLGVLYKSLEIVKYTFIKKYSNLFEMRSYLLLLAAFAPDFPRRQKLLILPLAHLLRLLQ